MGNLRVISGTAKGIRLKTVPGDTTRPITDVVKEALFNILGDEIQGAAVLDLFAGTGAVGIEALSRGAVRAVFLDLSPLAVKTIKENLSAARLTAQAVVRRADAFTYLNETQLPCFDLIYVAPPQYKGLWEKALRLIDSRPEILSQSGQVIVQVNPLEWKDLFFTHLSEFDRRKYGDTLLVFLELRQLENDMIS